MSTSTNTEITPSRPINNDLQPDGRRDDNRSIQNLIGSEARLRDTRSELGSTSGARNLVTAPQAGQNALNEESGFPPQPESRELPQTQASLTGQRQTSDLSLPEQKTHDHESYKTPTAVASPLLPSATERAENRPTIVGAQLPQSQMPLGVDTAAVTKPDPSSLTPPERNREEKDIPLQNENADLRRSPSATGSQGDSAGNNKIPWGSVINGLYSIHKKRVEGVRVGLQKLGITDEYVENIVSMEAIHLTKLLVDSLKKYATERSKKTNVSLDKLLDRVRSARNEGDVGSPTQPIAELGKPTWWSDLRREVKRLVLENSRKAVMELTNIGMSREVVDKLVEAVVEAEVGKLMVSIEAYGKARAEKAQASRKRISDSIFKTAGIAFSSPSAGKQVANAKKR